MRMNENGVSIIICCYNSKARIFKTLEALARQQIATSIQVEIILVDNASTDGTREFATGIWDELKAPFPLISTHEPNPGQLYARNKGVEISSYKYILFCDDDNWLSHKYVATIYNNLNGDDTVAACGGRGIPVFEISPPKWFDAYKEAFAIGPQNINSDGGRILNLYGAGLGVNKNILSLLKNSGFRSQLHGRSGTNLSSADDTELTYTFSLMGYRNIYCDDLLFHHYITAPRLQTAYLQKLFKAFGADGPVRNLYYAYLTSRPSHQQMKNWYLHFFVAIFRLFKYMFLPPKKDGRLIYFKWSIAYIKSLINIKKDYKKMKENIECVQAMRIKQAVPAKPLATFIINV